MMRLAKEGKRGTMDGRTNLVVPFLLLLLIFVIGTLGYHSLCGTEDHPVHWFDALYMTVITLTTVGYGETIDLEHNPAGRAFTIFLLIFGMGILLYCVSSVTAFVVEGNVSELLRRQRMNRLISEMKDHYIICGAGETGIHVVEELHRTRHPFVVIEADADRVRRIRRIDENIPIYEGDAEESGTLEAVGIERAKGLIAALAEDKDNIFLTITARQLNPALRIISRGVGENAAEKLRRAGADGVVSPNFIGGMRMASELIRPAVVSFLDLMLRDSTRTVRVEEVTIPPGSALIGQALDQGRIHEETGLLVIALRFPGDESFRYNPGSEEVLKEGCALIVIGDLPRIHKLREWVKRKH